MCESPELWIKKWFFIMSTIFLCILNYLIHSFMGRISYIFCKMTLTQLTRWVEDSPSWCLARSIPVDIARDWTICLSHSSIAGTGSILDWFGKGNLCYSKWPIGVIRGLSLLSSLVIWHFKVSLPEKSMHLILHHIRQFITFNIQTLTVYCTWKCILL